MDARSRGRDGKSYPAQPLARRQRYDVIVLTHQLCHQQGLSVRSAQAELAARGIRRSTGTICGDLSRPMCPACREPG